MNHEKKVDFLVIGTQKSGTTFLYEILKNHCDIEMSSSKELHFFDNEENFKDSVVDYTSYHANFSDNDKMWGEITPIYIYYREAIRRIWHYNRDIKLIAVLRNPIDRAYSHWNMEFNRKNDETTFDIAIRTEEIRSRESLPFQHRIYSYKDRGLYCEQIRNIYRFFPLNQVLIIKYDELKNFPEIMFEKIANFLDIHPFDDIQSEKIFSTKYNYRLPQSDYMYLYNFFYHDICSLEKLLNWDLSRWKLKRTGPFKVLFYRDYHGHTGGHSVVHDYFNFFLEHPDFEPYISFSQSSLFEDTNPWLQHKDRFVEYEPHKYDLLFVAGMDWKQIKPRYEEYKKVINLVQGIRHANPELPLYSFLSRKALRIAVSQQVKEYLENTRKTNGEIVVIENGIDLRSINADKKNDIFILGYKNRKLARKLYDALNNTEYSIELSLSMIGQSEYYYNLASSRIVVLLPKEEGEGFYLPALEAMYYSDIVVVPDVVGNRSFCRNGINSIVVNYDYDSIIKGVLEAIEIMNNKNRISLFKKNALNTVRSYSLQKQKLKFYKLLDRVINEF